MEEKQSRCSEKKGVPLRSVRTVVAQFTSSLKDVFGNKPTSMNTTVETTPSTFGACAAASMDANPFLSSDSREKATSILTDGNVYYTFKPTNYESSGSSSVHSLTSAPTSSSVKLPDVCHTPPEASSTPDPTAYNVTSDGPSTISPATSVMEDHSDKHSISAATSAAHITESKSIHAAATTALKTTSYAASDASSTLLEWMTTDDDEAASKPPTSEQDCWDGGIDAQPPRTAIEVVQSGDVRALRKMIQKNPRVLTRSANGDTLLHLSASLGNVDIIDILLRSGLEVDVRGENLRTPFQAAASAGHLPAMKRLLAAGAQLESLTARESTAFHLAASNGHIDVIKFLREAGANVNIVNKLGITPLLFAVVGGHLHVVRALIEMKACLNLKGQKFSAVANAAEMGHTDVLTMLLQKYECNTVEISAAVNVAANSDVVWALVDAFPGVVRGKPGLEALLNACREGREQTVAALLNAGVDVQAKDKNRCTGLHLAAGYGHAACLKALLERLADVEAESRNGDTALHRAARFGHAECVAVLLRAGADPRAENNMGQTPTQVTRCKEIRRLLKQ